MRPTLEDLKDNLRIDGDDEDMFLQAVLDTAIAITDKLSGRNPDEDFHDPIYQRYALLRASELHAERTGSVTGNRIAIKSLEALLRTGVGIVRQTNVN